MECVGVNPAPPSSIWGSDHSLSKGALFGDSGSSTSCCTVQSYFFCITWLANVNVVMKIIFVFQTILVRMQ